MTSRAFSTFAEVLSARAEAIPDHRAFVYLEDSENDARAISYVSLHERALGLAHVLRASIGVGERVLLLLPPGLDYVVAIFACLSAGVIAVPAPPPQPRHMARTLRRLLAITDSANVTAVIATTSLESAARAVLPEDHPLTNIRWVSVDTSEASTDTSIMARPDPADVAFLQYTSGSTSDPRGVRITHANLLDNSKFIFTSFGHDPSRLVGFNWIPPFHDMGLIGAILQPVFVGGLSVLTSPHTVIKRPIRWLRGISRYGVTTSGGPNFSYEMCVTRINEEECAGLDLSSWEVAFNGAEPIRAETMARFSAKFAPYGFVHKAFFPCYGLAEATLMVTASQKDERPTVRRLDRGALNANRAVAGATAKDPLLVGCGQPSQEHQLEIVDVEAAMPAAPGSVGEIWIKGPSVGNGYWGGPDSFDARLANGARGFLRTGDLGVLLEDELFVVGRLSDLIVRNGRNIQPQDIELLAESVSPALAPHASAAFELGGVADDATNVALIAEAASRDGEDLREAIASVRSNVAETLELSLALVAVCSQGSVPRTTSGKVQRKLCRSLLRAGELEIIDEWRSPALAEGLA